MGYKALKIELTDDPAPDKTEADSDTEVLENSFYKLVIDKSTGSISSLFDKDLKQELADQPESLSHRTTCAGDL